MRCAVLRGLRLSLRCPVSTRLPRPHLHRRLLVEVEENLSPPYPVTVVFPDQYVVQAPQDSQAQLVIADYQEPQVLEVHREEVPPV